MRAIVVGTDGSQDAERAIHRAAEIAKGTGARLHLVTAVPEVSIREPIASSARTQQVNLGAVAGDVLARASRELEAEGVAVETHARQGDPAHVLIEVAHEVEADLIVVGARGGNAVQRFLLGSVSSKLSHYATTSVMVVRAGEGD